MIIAANKSDNTIIKQVARIHKSELRNNNFLSECSETFIRLFYKTVTGYKSTMLYVDYDQNGEARGFIFCTTNKSRYFNLFLRNKFLRIFLFPSTYLPLFRRILYKAISRKASGDNVIDYETEIVYFAVANRYRRIGIGKKLISVVEEELKRRRINKVFLQIFADNNDALQFYKTSGFVIANKLVSKGQKKYLMSKTVY